MSRKFTCTIPGTRTTRKGASIVQVWHYGGFEKPSIVQVGHTIEALFDFMAWSSRFAGLTEYEMDRHYTEYEYVVDEPKSQSSLPFFDIAR